MTNFMRKLQKIHWGQLSRYGFLITGLICLLTIPVFAQTSISGVVTDTQTGERLPGVTIVVKGTTNGTVTNMDGNYAISAPADAILVFSFIGYAAQEIAVEGKSQIDIMLETETTQLDEIIAVGYGTARKEDYTGSVSSISGDALQKIPIANAAEALKGRLPGVNVLTTDGSPDAEVVIRVRGGGSVTQDNSPLFVVDGFIVSSIRDIPPSDISSINVLKDAAATAIYGAQASNGVVVITTNNPVAGKTKVSYNGYVQLKQLPSDRQMDVLDPYEYVMAQYEYNILQSDANLRNFEKFYGKYADLELYKQKKTNQLAG